MAKTAEEIVERDKKVWNYLNKQGRTKLFFSVFFLSIATFLITILISSNNYSLVTLFTFSIIFSLLFASSFLFKIQKKHLYSFSSFILLLIIIYFFKNFKITTPVEEIKLQNILISFAAVLSAIGSYGIFYSLFMNEGEKAVEMKTTLKLAKEIHETLVPAIEQTNNKLNIFGQSEAFESMGGDLIDYISLNGLRTVYIADVSGHGVSAGIVMSMFKGSMRTLGLEKQNIDNLFTSVNHALIPIKKKNMFLTAAGITFNDSNSVAIISSAGHLPVLHFSKTSENFSHYQTKQMPIGVSDKIKYKGIEVNYNEGDYFILLTDGLTENEKSFDNLAMLKKIEIFLKPKLKEEKPIDIISKDLFTEMKNQGNPIDDRSIIIIKCVK